MSWENFKEEEFACKHCGKNGISHELINKLQSLRTELDFPFVITSGYRCEEHPIEARKKTPGTHAEGLAADIYVRGDKALQIVSKARDYGFTGVGVNQKGNSRFIHLDISEEKTNRPRPHIWSY